MLVVDFSSPGKVRACARFDAARVAAAMEAARPTPARCSAQGHLAMTIDQGADMSRYQGLVALDGGSLEDAAHEYFRSSEQIPTRVRLAVAEESRARRGGQHRWRAGGILLQFLPKAPERARVADLRSRRRARRRRRAHASPEDDAWVEGRSLIDDRRGCRTDRSALSSERLVYRLFHERGRARVPRQPTSRRNARARASGRSRC